MRIAFVKTVSLLLFVATFSPGGAAIAQGTPSIAVAVAAGDTDGALARAIGAALDAELAPGGVQAACQIKREQANAAAQIEATLEVADATFTSRVALVSQPNAVEIRPTAEFGPASSVEELAAIIASDILRGLCGSGLDPAPAVEYDASGGGSNIVITGHIAALDREFTLQGSFAGGTALLTYVPVSPGGGAVSYELSGSGVTGSGEGVYTLAPQTDGTVILEQTTTGCVDSVGGSCRTNEESILLTPTGR